MAVTSFFVQLTSSLQEVMLCIDRNAKGICLVVDDEQHLIATLTDGDIRRAILGGHNLRTPVSEILEYKQDSAYPQPISAPVDAEKADLLKLMQQKKVRQIPLLDSDERVVELVTLDELLPQKPTSIQAVVMAGGFGTRLHPLTEDVPKPMLPVGERPLLELTVDQLREAGIQQVNITTHYKPEKIVEHFGDGQAFGVNINYVSEKQPLGTAGALGLLEPTTEPLLVMNGDILTRVDFQAMLAYHLEHKADLTVAVRQYDLNVPYGVLECEGPHVKQLREKPSYNFLVNAGIYLLQSTVYQYIPPNQRFDMTDLIEALIEAGCSVVSFPIIEYWLDIGQHADYEQAQEDLRNGRFL